MSFIKKKVRFPVILIIFAAVSYFGYIYYLSWLMQKDIEASKKSIMEFDFSCANGSVEKLERWSKTGYSRGCYKNGLRNGKWIAWEGGFLHIDGFFLNGNPDGEWKFFNKDGSIFKIILYDGGKEIEEKTTQRNKLLGK